MEGLLLKVPEVAGMLRLSRAKVYELLRSGALPSVRIDGARRVRVSDLRSYVDGLACAGHVDEGEAA